MNIQYSQQTRKGWEPIPSNELTSMKKEEAIKFLKENADSVTVFCSKEQADAARSELEIIRNGLGFKGEITERETRFGNLAIQVQREAVSAPGSSLFS